MAWTTPKTNWTNGELVTAEDMNAVGENLAALKHPATAVYTTAENIITTASIDVFTDVDSDNLNLTITTAGGDVLVHFDASIRPSSHSAILFDIEVDGARLGNDDGILTSQNHYSGAETSVMSFTRMIQNLSAGSHSFKLQWKGGRSALNAGAQFWVREI